MILIRMNFLVKIFKIILIFFKYIYLGLNMNGNNFEFIGMEFLDDFIGIS
jgi:hypothetical protein